MVAISANIESKKEKKTQKYKGYLREIVVAGAIGISLFATPIKAKAQTMAASPSTATFPNTIKGQRSVIAVTLSCNSTSPCTISGQTFTGSSEFTTSGAPSSIAAGGTAKMKVTFAPAATGVVTGTDQIANNTTTNPLTIKFNGAGVNSHSATLSSNTCPGSISGYTFYRSTISGGYYAQLNQTLESTPNYTDTTIAAGVTYYYVETCTNTVNEQSAFSNQVQVNTPYPMVRFDSLYGPVLNLLLRIAEH